MHYLRARIGEAKFYKTFNEMLENVNEETGELIITVSVYIQLMFYDKQDSGLSVYEEWEKQDLEGLSNDEKIIMRSRSNSQATIIEIEKILDHGLLECKDLLDPDAGIFRVMDRSFSKTALRYDRFLVRLEKGPYYSTLNVVGLKIPQQIRHHFIPNIKQILIQRKERCDNEAVIYFLSREFVHLPSIIRDMHVDQMQTMLNNMDFHHCIARYEIVGNITKIENILDEKPEFRVIDNNDNEKDYIEFEWLRIGESKDIEKSMISFFQHKDSSESYGVLGSIKVYENILEIEILSKKKYAFAKQMIKKYFKDLVTLKAEKVEDSAKQMANRMTEESQDDDLEDEEEYFPKEEENIPREMEQESLNLFYKNHYQKFLDDEIPMLGNITPRQAANDPKKREALIDLMKEHLNGMENMQRDKGVIVNIDWVLDELNLTELKR